MVLLAGGGRIGRAEATPDLILIVGLAVGPMMAVASLLIPQALQ